MAITLLPPEFQAQGRQVNRVFRTVWQATSVVVVIYLMALIVMVGVFAWFLIRKSELVGRYNNLRTQVANLKDREAPLFVLKNRISQLAKIKENESAFTVGLSHVVNLVGSDPRLTIINVVSNRDSVKISVEASDSFALEGLVAALEKSTVFNQVELDTFNRSPNGKYIASFVIQL